MSFILKKKVILATDVCSGFTVGSVVVTVDEIEYVVSGGTLNYVVSLRSLPSHTAVDSEIITSDGTYSFTGVSDGYYYLDAIDANACEILSTQIQVTLPTTTTTTTTTLAPTTTTTTTTLAPTTTTTTTLAPTTTTTTTLAPTTTTTTTTISPTKFDATVQNTIETSDSKYMVTGSFSDYSGTALDEVVKLNTTGSISDTFTLGGGFTGGVVFKVIETSDNKFMFVGAFTAYSGVTANRIMKLNSDGTIDNTFDSGTGFDAATTVYDILETSDNKFVVVGTFSQYSGVTRNRIVKINTNGAIDDTFDYSTGFGSSSNIYRIIETSDNKYLIAGQFSSYNSTSANNAVLIDSGGTIDSSFKNGPFNTLCHDVIETSDSKYLFVGAFTAYSGVTANRIMKLNVNGTIDFSFTGGSGFNSGGASRLYIINTTDNKQLIGGNFTTYSGVTVNRIVKLNNNGTVDESFDMGTGFNGSVDSLLNTSDDKYLIGGNFTTYNSISGNRIFKLDTDGSIIW